MKKCFTCKRKYPLFLFSKNNRKYQRPENKGRVYNCRMCTYKYILKNNMSIYNCNKDNKFIKIEFKSKLEVFKYVLK